MSKESVKMFLSVFKQDEALKAKLNKVKTEDEVMGVIKEAGFDLMFDELKEIWKREGVKLTDDELDDVSGGGLFGIDLCQNTYSYILCELSFCSHFRKELIDRDIHGNRTYKRYCDNSNPPWKETYTKSPLAH
ncbi:Nif11-like leader peptide family RiPP precursor [Petroclostridium sp. X23]|uniref:Nif11-like leader peptide family RiPP precursor n=1 Tax=Petroclostridium sp. X23 TaxID=3045146 RepID=UPI0024ADB1BB|nr:Nif11-like leader peptide family RiPP precursor [Petroclostridium sp. X23]WHH58784.1 Nif11-like leader peptide family RiPP precursor [Petroclostridium sp. X23]